MTAASEDGPRKRAVPAVVWLAIAVTLFGAGTPVLKALVDRGGHLGSMLADAISYCNVLFVGNICSAALVVAIYRPRRVFGALRSLSPGQWTALLINTLLSCVFAPALIITALESTTATAVVLLLQTDAIFLAVSGVLFFGERLSARAWTGLILIGAGATVLAVFAGAGLAAAGVIAAAALRSLGNAAARADLARDETLPAFLFVRNLLGAVIFFGIAMWLFGPHHFMDTFSPGLWELMIVYAGAIVLLGQLSWYRAVSTLPGGTVSAAWTLAPVVSLVVAYLLLGEVPGGPQWVSVGLVFAGLAVMKLGVRHTEKGDTRPAAGTERTLAGSE